MHRFANQVVAAEAEADVADAAADFGQREILFDPPGGPEEIGGVIGVFLHAGADGQHVGVENDVLRRESDLLREQIVSPPADLSATGEGLGLAAFVERHHNDRRAIATDEPGLLKELRFAFLQ